MKKLTAAQHRILAEASASPGHRVPTDIRPRTAEVLLFSGYIEVEKINGLHTLFRLTDLGIQAVRELQPPTEGA